MSPSDTEAELQELGAAFRQGKLSRRQFVQQSAGCLLSAVLMNNTKNEMSKTSVNRLNDSPGGPK